METSLSGFGGVLPWARRTLVEKRRWLAPDEFTDMIGLCQFLPGPNIVNVSVCVGARFHGVSGVLAAFAGLMIAPFFLVLGLGMLYTLYGHLAAVESLFRGISAAAAGLVVSMGLKMASSRQLRSLLAVFVVITFVGIAVLRLPLVIVLLAIAPLSIAAAWWRRA